MIVEPTDSASCSAGMALLFVPCVTTACWMERGVLTGGRILTAGWRVTMFGIARAFCLPTWPALIDLHRGKGHTSVIQRLRCFVATQNKGHGSAECGPTSGGHEHVVVRMPVQHSCCPRNTNASLRFHEMSDKPASGLCGALLTSARGCLPDLWRKPQTNGFH